MVGSIWSPAATFQEIRQESVRPWIPILVHALMAMLVVGTLLSRVDLAEFLLAQASRQGTTLQGQQLEAARTTLSSPIIPIVIASLPVVFVPIMFLVVAGIYFAMFLIFGSTARYGQYLSLLSFAYTPQILNSWVIIALAFVLRPTSLDPSLLGSVSPAILITLAPGTVTPGPLFTAASSLNLFTVWVLILLVIAFRGLVSRRTSTLTVSVGVLIPWLVYVAYRVGMAAIFA